MSNKLPPRSTPAHYQSCDASHSSLNPLILALPQRLDPGRMKKSLSVSVENFDHAGMTLAERELHIKKLRRNRVITDDHLLIYYELSSMIAHGYEHRNPQNVATTAWSYDIADPAVPLADIQMANNADGIVPTTADAMLLMGFSGNGKSTSVEHMLYRLFPQIIEHDYNGFDDVQVVYLKVDMPHNAARTGLIHAILAELDRVLSYSSYGNPQYADTVKRSGKRFIDVDSMEKLLVTVLNRHHVGLLVVDEFQNTLVASERYRNELLQLFDTLANRLYVPSLKIGTPDVQTLFSKKFRHQRRLGRSIELNRLTGASWDEAMTRLFAFQPLNRPIERHAAIEELLQNLTAGVPSILFKLWEAALVEAMYQGTETITPSIIKNAFSENFPMLRAAVRHINGGKRGRFADLLTVHQLMDSGQNAAALKQLSKFVRSMDGATDDVVNDIESSIDITTLTESDKRKFEKIKARLDELRSKKLGPQTLEHKP